MLISQVQILAGEKGVKDDSSLKSMHHMNASFTPAMQQWPIKIS